MATQPVVTENQPEVDQATGKFVFVYQPRDADGQFIGKPYRFLYTDMQDLNQQIIEAKEHADRVVHEIKIGKRQIVGEAAVKVPDFKPAPESTDEAEKKRREQTRKDIEAEFGAPIEDVRNRVKRAGELDEYLAAQNWAMNKEAEGYYPCRENAKKIAAWIKEKGYANTPANYDLAFEELKDTLVPKPQEQAPPADSTQQQTTSTRTEARPQSTSVMPGQFSGTRPPNRTEKPPLTKERYRQISKMSFTQFQQLKRANPDEYWTYVKMKEAKALPQ